MKKIGVYGGSFDPIHYGHLILAEQLREEAGLDKVVFIPTYISPFKKAIKATDGQDRLQMLKASFLGNPYFEVSDIELQREGTSYTIDTLEYLRDQYKDAQIYFIMGTDAFLGIEGWYRSKDLLSNFRFLIGMRKGYKNEELLALIEELKTRYPLNARAFDIPELELSSSDLRFRCQAGRSIKYLTPDPVIGYIKDHGLYSDLLARLEEFAIAHQSEHRLAHTRGVVAAAEKYALKFGADPFKAKVAAWFHDNYKSAGNLEHSYVAAEEIKKQFGISDPDILNALRYHTTGRPAMSLLEKVIKLADQLEEGRDFCRAEEQRAAAEAAENIDEVILMILKSTKEYVLSQGLPYDDLSQAAIDYYEALLKK